MNLCCSINSALPPLVTSQNMPKRLSHLHQIITFRIQLIRNIIVGVIATILLDLLFDSHSLLSFFPSTWVVRDLTVMIYLLVVPTAQLQFLHEYLSFTSITICFWRNTSLFIFQIITPPLSLIPKTQCSHTLNRFDMSMMLPSSRTGMISLGLSLKIVRAYGMPFITPLSTS